MKVDVSIIIVNYGSSQLVIDCVDSIQKKVHGLNYEIIVVDNGSEDDSVKQFNNKLNGKIRLIESPQNLGFGKANNLGAKYAEGEYLFLLNPDTLLINNAVRILHSFLQNNQKTGIAGGNLYTQQMDGAPSYSLRFDSLRDEWLRSTWTSILSEKVRDKIQFSVPVFSKSSMSHVFNGSGKCRKVAYIFGADMMLSKKLFDSVGGFDPDFFMYGEEEELTRRITKIGYDIVNVPAAKIIHLESATLKAADVFHEKSFMLRMNGTMTYFYKIYGSKGVRLFHRFRSRRYRRLVFWGKCRGKETGSMIAMKQYELFNQCFLAYPRKGK